MAKSINHVTLLGNLGKAPEVKYTPKGTPVARLSLATNQRFKDKDGQWQDRAEWHNLILWSGLAELAGRYLNKGSKIAVEGELRTRSWESEGTRHYMTEIICSDLVMLDSKPHQQQAQEKAEPAAPTTGPITDEDIPF